ncbi:MAG: tetratricopeptide repeat protein [Isosphaerales bacterium]
MSRSVRLNAWSLAALVILAGLGVAAATWGGPVTQRLAYWMRSTSSRVAEAQEAYEKGNWERAALLSRELLKTKGSDPEVLRVYARASARLERDGMAAAIYNNRLGSARMQPEDLFLKGLALVRALKPESALELWEKAVEDGPDHPELLDHLTRLSIRMQRLDEAAAAARRLARQAGWQARGSLLLGEIQGLLENPKGAALALREAFEHDPGARGAPFAAAHYQRLLARSLLQLGRPAEARGPLESVFASTGASRVDPEANWLLSRALLQEGKFADASAALARAGSYRSLHPLTAEPSPYVGAARCAECHPEINRNHLRSRHSQTFHHGPELLELPFPDHPLADPDDPKVTHAFSRDQGRIEVKTQAGDHVYNTVVEYAFGIRGRYITMVGRDDERKYRALRLSSYQSAAGASWGRTAGDVSDPNHGENIRGAPIQVRDGVVRCLYCHVTQSREFRDPRPEAGVGPEAADSGIGCERCHGPGANHLAAIKADFPETAIVNVGAESAATITAQCADCHIVSPPSQISRAPDDPHFVRSPGMTLTFSRCYSESDGGMSCLTCHDPHRDDLGPAAFYEAKCLACHSRQEGSRAPIAREDRASTANPAVRGKVCPVNAAKNCLDCHMPKVPVPTLHTSLTDHYIRVIKRSK